MPAGYAAEMDGSVAEQHLNASSTDHKYSSVCVHLSAAGARGRVRHGSSDPPIRVGRRRQGRAGRGGGGGEVALGPLSPRSATLQHMAAAAAADIWTVRTPSDGSTSLASRRPPRQVKAKCRAARVLVSVSVSVSVSGHWKQVAAFRCCRPATPRRAMAQGRRGKKHPELYLKLSNLCGLQKTK